MCANCVAQGAAYVGGAVGALQVMRARARHRRLARQLASADDHGPTAAPAGDPGAGTVDVRDTHMDTPADTADGHPASALTPGP